MRMPKQSQLVRPVGMSVVYIGAGSFSIPEAYFAELFGVVDTEVGYANGNRGARAADGIDEGGFVEVLRLIYDPSRLDIAAIVGHYVDLLGLLAKGGEGRYGYVLLGGSEQELEELRAALRCAAAATPALSGSGIADKVRIELLRNYSVAPPELQGYYQQHPEAAQGGEVGTVLSVRPRLPQGPRLKNPLQEELKKELSADTYRILFENATEFPFENEYWNMHDEGLYVDIISGAPLFLSSDKFDSGTGWPSFARPISRDALRFVEDNSFNVRRIEVRSSFADTHLGHVFPDGPRESGGLRYCMNSAALRFIAKQDLVAAGYGAFLPYIKEAELFEDPMQKAKQAKELAESGK